MTIDIIAFNTGAITDIELSAQNSEELLVFYVDISSQYDISSVSINNDVSFSHIDENTNIYYFKKLFNKNDYNEGSFTEVFTLTVEDVSSNIAQKTLNINLQVYDYYVKNVSYYVTINANINDNLYTVPDPCNNSLNIIGLSGGIVESLNGNVDVYDVCYNLPIGSLTISAGFMIAGNYSNNHTDTEFIDTVVDVSLNKVGDLSSSFRISIRDSQIDKKLAIVDENLPYVKILNWPSTDLTSIENKTQQELLDMVKNDFTIYYLHKDDVDTLVNGYNLNVIDSWKFSITRIEAVKNNIIELYADDNNRTYPNIFNEGEHIILETSNDYDIKIYGTHDQPQSLVSHEKVYAVVTHDSTKPSFY